MKSLSNPKKDVNTPIDSSDISLLQSKEGFTSVIHKELLNKILNTIKPVNFIEIISNEAKELILELNTIKTHSKCKNNSTFRKLNKTKSNGHLNRESEITERLAYLKAKLKQKNYVVCIVDCILNIAEMNHWNICKKYDYIYVYNGEYWKQLSKDDLIYFLGEAAIKLGYPTIDAKYHKFKEELLKQFLTQAHLPTPEINETKTLINLKNGTFEFSDHGGKLRNFSAFDFLTYQLPFCYDPNGQCPQFTEYLLHVLPDWESRLILQEFSGYIFADIHLEKCLVLTGQGSNGKSVFFNIIKALVGKENMLTFPLGQFNTEYNRAKLTDVLLNYSSEKGADLNTEIFKTLISGEPVQAREPYGKPFEILNKVKFILNCNELPKETENTDAYFRRFIILPFSIKISESERNVNLASNIIKNELPGVFNWLLEGLKRLEKAESFTVSTKSDKALADFKKQSDTVAMFIEEKDYKYSSSKETLSDLYKVYRIFCLDDGYKPLGKNKFSSTLESKGFESCRSNDGSKAFYIEN